MGFMDQFAKMAEGMAGGGDQQAANAASEHVENADPSETADHLAQSVPNMDHGALVSLGTQLLHHFTSNSSFAGNGNDAAQAAGVDPSDVKAGDPGAIQSLLQYAKQNPQVLQSAASAFMQHNPGAIASLAPGLLQGIMGRFGGGAAAQDER